MAIDFDSVKRRYTRLASDLGAAGLHARYPNDFEYYAMSLELVDGEGNTIDYFIFPVMPSNISKSTASRVNIKKTLNSTVVIQNKSFIPQNITLKGDFGKTFKILLKPTEAINFSSLASSIKDGIMNGEETGGGEFVKQLKEEFNPVVKTGYGSIKILQSIISKAVGIDSNGNSNKLYLYNPALGESYLVVPTASPLILSQNTQNMNMIWGYTLNLTIVANLNSSKTSTPKTSFVQSLAPSAIQKAVNTATSSISNSIRRAI